MRSFTWPSSSCANFARAVREGLGSRLGSIIILRFCVITVLGSIPVSSSIYGRGSARYNIDSFSGCRGYEQSLFNCRRGSVFLTLDRYIIIYDSAGVICQGIAHNSSICVENATRLVNGSNVMEGRVEICAYGTWVTMCDYVWGIEETKTVCRHLGYPSEGTFMSIVYLYIIIVTISIYFNKWQKFHKDN